MVSNVTIRKQKIKIKTYDEALAFSIRKKITETLQYGLIDILNNAFNKYNFADEYVYIDKLHLQLDKINSQQFDNNFLKLFEEKLTAELHKTLYQVTLEKRGEPNFKTKEKGLNLPAQLTSANEQEQQTVLYFLQNGYLPWWFKNDIETPTETYIKNACNANAGKLLKAIAVLAHTISLHQINNIITRLIYYISNTILQQQIEILILEKEEKLRKIYSAILTHRLQIIKTLGVSAAVFEKRLLHILLSGADKDLNETATFFIRLAEENITFKNDAEIADKLDVLLSLIPEFGNTAQLKENIVNSLKQENKTKKQNTGKQKQESNREAFLYINNSGLVILHPFLESLFKELGLLDDKSLFISAHAQQRAAVTLYYLQCGSKEYKEWEMIFNKIICDIPQDDVIENDIELTDTEIKECNNLLEIVINYWEALRGASKEALQQTFLQRNGKLSLTENNWLLQVEKTGTDILLERLPWGYSTVKFPWLSKMIYTEW